MAEHSSYPGVQPGQVFYCQEERDQLVAHCIPSFPGHAYVAYAVVVHKSYKGTVDYAVAPQDYGCNKCYKIGLETYSLHCVRTQRHGLDSY